MTLEQAASVDRSTRPYVLALQNSRDPYVSDALIAQIKPAPVVVIAVPSLDSTGAFKGIITGVVQLDVLRPPLEALSVHRKGWIVDGAGNLIVGPQPITKLEQAEASLLDAIRSSDTGVRRGVRGPAGESNQVVSFARVSGSNWTVVVAEGADASLARASRDRLTKLATWAGFAVIAVAAAWLVGRRIDRILNRRMTHWAGLRDAQSALLAASTVEQVTEAFNIHAQRLLAAHTAAVVIRGDNTRLIQLAQNHPLFGRKEFPDAPSWRAARTGQRVSAATATELQADYPELAAKVVPLGMRAVAAVPLPELPANEPGAVSIAFDVDRTLDHDEWGLLEELANHVAIALLRCRDHDAERAARQTADRLLAVATELSRATRVADVAATIVRQVRAWLDAHGAATFLCSADRQNLVAVAWLGYPDPTIEPWRITPVDAPLPGPQAFRANQPAFIEDFAVIVQRDPELAPFVAAVGDAAAVCLPLGAPDSEPFGLLYIGFADARTYTTDERRLMIALAQHGSDALLRAQAFEQQLQERALSELKGDLLVALESVRSFEQRAAALVKFVVPRLAVSARVEAVDPTTGSSAVIAESEHFAEDGLAVDATIFNEAVSHELPLTEESGETVTLRVWVDSKDDRGAIDILRQLASHATSLLEGARLADYDHRTAVTLQHALLPSTVVMHDHLATCARYRPSDGRLEVGGDWFETVDLGNDVIAFAVGDVVGQGLGAAAVMGQLRSAFAALAPHSEGSPAQLLDALDTFARRVDGAEGSTVCCAVLDIATSRLTYANGGHPPPLLLLPDRPAMFLDDGKSWPLCLDARRARSEGVTTLDPGAAVLLYSDGLIERRGEHYDVSLARFRESANRASSDSLEQYCDALLDEFTSGRHLGDDVVLLAIRNDNHPGRHLVVSLPAIPQQLARLRVLLRNWLQAHRVADAERIVVAVSEAVTNAIEHAYLDRRDGEVRILGTIEPQSRVLTLTVGDGGRWREHSASKHRLGGHGINVMQALADRTSVRHEAAGTTVTLEFDLEHDEGGISWNSQPSKPTSSTVV